MLGAERLHQWGNLVQVVPRHGGEEAEGTGGQSEYNTRTMLSTSSYSQAGRQAALRPYLQPGQDYVAPPNCLQMLLVVVFRGTISERGTHESHKES